VNVTIRAVISPSATVTGVGVTATSTELVIKSVTYSVEAIAVLVNVPQSAVLVSVNVTTGTSWARLTKAASSRSCRRSRNALFSLELHAALNGLFLYCDAGTTALFWTWAIAAPFLAGTADGLINRKLFNARWTGPSTCRGGTVQVASTVLQTVETKGSASRVNVTVHKATALVVVATGGVIVIVGVRVMEGTVIVSAGRVV
jgi:hypothetical protein